MSYLTQQETVDLLFKLSQGAEESKVGKFFFEEPPLDQSIWTEGKLIPTTAPVLNDGESSGVVTKREALELQPVPGSPNAFRHDNLKDAISYKFGDGSYDWTLVDSNDQPIPKGQYSWLKMPKSSILYFYGGAPGNMPPKITFFQYTGQKDVFSGGGAGSESFRGNFDPEPGNFPTEGSGEANAVVKGDYWRMTQDGEFTGMTPVAKVTEGDLLFAAVDDAANPEDFFAVKSNVDLTLYALLNDPRFNTTDEKAALSAASSPNASNPFVTDSYLQSVISGIGLVIMGANLENDTPGSLVIGNKLAHKAIFIEYSIKRDSLIEVGTIRLTNSEANNWVSRKSELDDCGFSFTKTFDGDDIKLNWTDDLQDGNAGRIDMIVKYIPL